MRTAKKALALIIVFASALSMMAGASFTDKSDIDALDAVNTLSALGIIAGFPDGSFKPEQIVTRAEMAKMIYVLKNAGRDDKAAYFKNSVNAFYDTKGHWAEGYINYCHILGIVAGKGGGVFDPDAPVAGLEAAKMLLVTLGYNAAAEGLVGPQWAIRSAALAQSANFFEDYDAGIGEGAPRQYAARMIVNALDAAVVAYEKGAAQKQYDSVTNKPITLGSRTLGIFTAEDVLVSNGNYSYNGPGSGAAEGRIILAGAGTFTFGASDELVGQKVKVIYRDSNGSGGLDPGDRIVGLAALASNNIVTFTKGDIDTESATEIKLKTTGTKHKIRASVNMVKNNRGAGAAAYPANLKTNSADKITLIDNDGDGYYDVVKVVEKTFTQVAAVGSGSISLRDGGTIDFDGNAVYSGVAKNDFVFVTRNYSDSAENNVVEKAAAVTATLDGRNSAGDLYIGGAYVSVDKAAAGANLKSSGKVDFFWNGSDLNASPELNKTLDFYMYGKYWVAANGTESTIERYAVLTDVETIGFSPRAKVLFADNSKGIYYLEDGKIRTDSGTGRAPLATDTDKVYKYTINSSNEIRLVPITATTILDYDSDTRTISGPDTGTKLLTDDTAIFVLNTTDGTWKAYAYGDIRTRDVTSESAAEYVLKDSTFKLAVFRVGGGITAGASGLTYGFLTASPTYTKSGDDYLVCYTIWNGKETLVKTMNHGTGEPAFSGKAVKGAFVSFRVKTDGTIVKTDGSTGLLEDMNPSVLTDARIFDVIGSVIGVDLTGTGTSSTGFYQITKDTRIIFIDAGSNKGAAGEDVTTFDATRGEGKFNASFIAGAGNKLEAIFIDVNSDINA